jgi:zinc transporter, ZIP family
MVEPVAAVAGAAAVLFARPILPYALAFAAGAMIFVVAEELVPEAKRGSPDVAALSLKVGFSVMMILDAPSQLRRGISQFLHVAPYLPKAVYCRRG